MRKIQFLLVVALSTTLSLTGTIAPFDLSQASAAPSAPSRAALSSSVKLDKKSTLTVLPANYDGKYVTVAVFGAPQKNRAVSLQYKNGKKWKQVASAKMDAKGRATFTVVKPGTKTYRAVADTHTIGKKKYAAVSTATTKAGAQWKSTLKDSFSGSKVKATWATRGVDIYSGSRLCSAPDSKLVTVKDGKAVLSIRKLDPKKDKAKIASVVKAAKKEQQARKDAALKAAKRLKGTAKTKALAAAKAMKTPGCPHGVFGTGIIDTRDSFQQSEGMLAAKVKFPKAQGMHGSVWLQTMRNNSLARPAGAEIDMIESFGYGKGVTNYIHVDTKGKGKLDRFGNYIVANKTKDPKWWDKYHVYSVEWTRSEFVFRVDGLETNRIKKNAVKGDQYYLLLSLLSSDWEMPLLTKPTTSKKTPGVKKANLPKSKMYVDWIEVWERA